MNLAVNKMLLVLTILLVIGYTKSSTSTSCQLYTKQHLKLIKFHNQPLQKIILDSNFIGENVNACLSLHPNSYYHLNSVHLSLMKVNNTSNYTGPIVFYKRWNEFDLRNTRINNQLCIRYENPQNFKLSVQLIINVKQTGKNFLAIRDLKLCYTHTVSDRIKRSLQIMQGDVTNGVPPNWSPPTTEVTDGWPPTNTESTTTTTETTTTESTTTTTTHDPNASWTAPTWPSTTESTTPIEETTTPDATNTTEITTTTTTHDPNASWTAPTWPSTTESTTVETTTTTTHDPNASWTAPVWPTETTTTTTQDPNDSWTAPTWPTPSPTSIPSWTSPSWPFIPAHK